MVQASSLFWPLLDVGVRHNVGFPHVPAGAGRLHAPAALWHGACTSQARGWALPEPTDVLLPHVRGGGKLLHSQGQCIACCIAWGMGEGSLARVMHFKGCSCSWNFGIKKDGTSSSSFLLFRQFLWQNSGGVRWQWLLLTFGKWWSWPPLSACCRSRKPVPAGRTLHPPLAIVSFAVISPGCLSSSGSLNVASPDAGN